MKANGFLLIAGGLLAVTAAAKLYSSFPASPVLLSREPVFMLPLRSLFIVSGILELAIALYCIWSRSNFNRALLIVCISTTFVLYRAALLSFGYTGPCPCLGTVTDSIGISPEKADYFLLSMLITMLIGGSVILFREYAARSLSAGNGSIK